MVYDVTKQQLVELRTSRPHVVVLGAGASLAAFPNGDAHGKILPLMANVLDVLDLRDLVDQAGYDSEQNFESLYSTLHTADPNSTLIKQIEQRVTEYFSSLELPQYLTLYDLLLLSLREKDAIFTFNWDPFLADACMRKYGPALLPHIFHLHGNVRVSFCDQCRKSTRKLEVCPFCEGKLTPTRLLYPIEKKDYASDPFTSTQWDAARDYISQAGIITFFGYSAPTTDQEAMAIFTNAWKGDDPHKPIERLEVIDIRDRDELAKQWSSFSFFDHKDIRRSFFESMLALYPRRSCEALVRMGFDGNSVEPIPWAGSLDGVQKSIQELIASENRPR